MLTPAKSLNQNIYGGKNSAWILILTTLILRHRTCHDTYLTSMFISLFAWRCPRLVELSCYHTAASFSWATKRWLTRKELILIKAISIVYHIISRPNYPGRYSSRFPILRSLHNVARSAASLPLIGVHSHGGSVVMVQVYCSFMTPAYWFCT